MPTASWWPPASAGMALPEHQPCILWALFFHPRIFGRGAAARTCELAAAHCAAVPPPRLPATPHPCSLIGCLAFGARAGKPTPTRGLLSAQGAKHRGQPLKSLYLFAHPSAACRQWSPPACPLGSRNGSLQVTREECRQERLSDAAPPAPRRAAHAHWRCAWPPSSSYHYHRSYNGSSTPMHLCHSYTCRPPATGPAPARACPS